MNSTHKFLWLIAVIACSMTIRFAACAQEVPANEAQTPPPGYAIKYEREGGYFGAHDKLWIYPDGRVIDAAGKIAQIPADAVRRWVKSIIPVTAPHLAAAFPPLTLCMDCMTYRITVYEKDTTRILVLSGAGSTVGGGGKMDLEDMRRHLRKLKWK